MVENVRRALGDERSKLIKNHARTAWRLDLSYRRLHRRTVYTLPREDGTANEEAEQDASPLEDAEDEQASESDKVPAHRSDAEVSADMLEWVKSVNGQRFMCLCRYVGGMDDIFQHAKVLAVHSLVYTVKASDCQHSAAALPRRNDLSLLVALEAARHMVMVWSPISLYRRLSSGCGVELRKKLVKWGQLHSRHVITSDKFHDAITDAVVGLPKRHHVRLIAETGMYLARGW